MANDLAGVWWPVCLSEAPNARQPVGVQCGEHALVLFRDGAGQVRAVEDRCPHRRAPLSLGRLPSDGLIQCGYHGWTFDGASGRCVKIPNLRPDERVPERYGLTAYPVHERDGFVHVWVHSARAEPSSAPPAGTVLDGFTGACRVTIAHGEFVAALLDDPGLVLSIPGVAITAFSISDVTFDGPDMVVERGAHWGRASRKDRFAGDYPLILKTRTHHHTGRTELRLESVDGEPVLEALIACAPDRRGVTAASWRGRLPAGMGGIRGTMLRAWCGLTGAAPLIIRSSVDGPALAKALQGPSIAWRERLRTMSSAA